MFLSNRAFLAQCFLSSVSVLILSGPAYAIEADGDGSDLLALEEACESGALDAVDFGELRDLLCAPGVKYECDAQYEVECNDGTTKTGRGDKKKNKNKDTASRQAQDSAQEKANDFCGGASKVKSIKITDIQCTETT